MCLNNSYKQQHQIFVQHASQQIAILETQKLALKSQQQQSSSQASQQSQQQQQQQPPPVQQSQDPPPLSLLSNECDALPNSQNNMNGNTNSNSNNFISNNRTDNRINNVPPPLMSQNITMPPRTGMNLNFIPSPQQRINYPSDNNFEQFTVNLNPWLNICFSITIW